MMGDMTRKQKKMLLRILIAAALICEQTLPQ